MKVTKRKLKCYRAYQRWLTDNYLRAFIIDQNSKVIVFQIQT